MQYFLIEAETQDPLPEIINWYGKINPQYINEKDADKIKNWELLNVKVCQDTVFPDVLSDPFFMLSKNAAEIVSHYEPGIRMIGIQLFSRKNRILLPYFSDTGKNNHVHPGFRHVHLKMKHKNEARGTFSFL